MAIPSVRLSVRHTGGSVVSKLPVQDQAGLRQPGLEPAWS